MITECENKTIIQQFRDWGLYEAAVVKIAEDDDDDVEQKMQWFLICYQGHTSSVK